MSTCVHRCSISMRAGRVQAATPSGTVASHLSWLTTPNGRQPVSRMVRSFNTSCSRCETQQGISRRDLCGLSTTTTTGPALGHQSQFSTARLWGPWDNGMYATDRATMAQIVTTTSFVATTAPAATTAVCDNSTTHKTMMGAASTNGQAQLGKSRRDLCRHRTTTTTGSTLGHHCHFASSRHTTIMWGGARAATPRGLQPRALLANSPTRRSRLRDTQRVVWPQASIPAAADARHSWVDLAEISAGTATPLRGRL